MSTRLLIFVFALTLITVAIAEEKARADWDQSKAVDTIRTVKALEAVGQPWDKIAWSNNVEEAAARAKREGKPVFVFFFLKKNVGPAAAPC